MAAPSYTGYTGLAVTEHKRQALPARITAAIRQPLSNGIGLAVDDHDDYALRFTEFLKCDYLPAHPLALRAAGAAEHNKRVAPREGVSD
jgi:hypothetical protein